MHLGPLHRCAWPIALLGLGFTCLFLTECILQWSGLGSSEPVFEVRARPLLSERDREWLERRSEDRPRTHLGDWMLGREGRAPPPRTTNASGPFLILVWENGPFLERRHLRRFTRDKRFSPWDGCSVSNCRLTYQASQLPYADAVLFHLHRTPGARSLPPRPDNPRQRWVFLTDESPLHTFYYSGQRLSDYDGLFNWSMSYRMDSDVPVPYGRTQLKTLLDFEPRAQLPRRDPSSKLVAILGSNCAGRNKRWEYVRQLRQLLGDDLDILGSCLQGNQTVCPGHFDRDCPRLSAYKFYLAFENSNCREYLTEKVFWNAYGKGAVPVIMGPPRTDCERLLPPGSFLHVEDYADPRSLADHLRYLGRHEAEYELLHAWRSTYRLLNEHGYFGSASKHYCRLCEALNYNPTAPKVYRDLESFWNKERDCSEVPSI